MDYKDIVSNVDIYDLEKSILASGYPMRTTIPDRDITEKDLARCKNLVNATKTGNGAHAQFMTGIRVNFDLTFSNKAWVEAERYRFLEFVSSQSTMHRITKFDLDNQYNKYVDPRIIEIMKSKVQEYNKVMELRDSYDKDDQHNISPQLREDLTEWLKNAYLEILYSNPAGFTLTARMTTNYRCLRNIYMQRKDHRLPEWRAFCKWIETLPYAQELLIN